MVLVGHVYIQSIMEYGNPFYPMKITIFGTELQGERDFSELSSTSIISNIDDVRVQQILFPTDKISVGGFVVSDSFSIWNFRMYDFDCIQYF